ncbi:restriction endonuclease subunit S [Xylella fastidiosa]|uniref:restriction endonuclease subunit S n=1 Tax=Xylella fastidiosa TaxID=2371 RepID=UPI001E610FB3|nr:restriction endonuclease subunit S [Xylella fastidiosa]
MTQKKHTISTAAVTSRHDASVPLLTFGIEWLQDVPGHWEVQRLKNIATVVLGKMLTTEIKDGDGAFMPYLRSMNVQWITPDVRDVKQMWISNSEMAQLRVRKGDLLVSEGGEVGRACIWNDEIPECYIQNSVHRVAAKSMMLPDFLLYQFFSYGKRGYFNAIVNRVSIAHLTREKLVTIPFTVPPLPEQKQIVAYLRAQDAHIARFIKAKRDLISLLIEQKLRIIDHAVTRGLDASVALKPSGIEWLGDVPVNWEVRRLKFLASNTTSQTTTKARDEIYLAMEHVQSWTGVARPLEGEVEFASTVKRFVVDDVLFGKLRPYLAKVTRAKCNGVCVSEFLVLRSRKEFILPAYLEQMLRCKRVIDLINSSTAGAKMPRADWIFIGNVRLPVPCKDVQEAILSHIESETKDLGEAITRTEDEIKLIREYRDRLITDVVTGQVDVRGWQPGPEDVVEDAVLATLGDDQEEMTEQEDDDDED